jgi:hypothetical protein
MGDDKMDEKKCIKCRNFIKMKTNNQKPFCIWADAYLYESQIEDITECRGFKETKGD